MPVMPVVLKSPASTNPTSVRTCYAQASIIKCVPDGLGYLSETKFALRALGAIGLPDNVEFFTLGGSEQFRGFDMARHRQDNAIVIGSIESRCRS